MWQVLTRPSLTLSLVAVVGLALAAMQAVEVATNAAIESRHILDMADRRATSALDMLEAVHVQAMLNRKQTNDGDAAIATLNGTMEQFTQVSRGVGLWVVMGPKIVAYQVAQGEQELEGPRDAVDAAAVATGVPQRRAIGKHTLRVTRPIILGTDHGSHERCAACHTELMGIQRGEVIGAYSASVDMRTEFADWRASVLRQAMTALSSIAVAVLLIYAVLRGMALGPLRRLAQATRALADGDTAVAIRDSGRSDELGMMAQALEVFRASLIANRQLEAEKSHAIESLQVWR